MADLNYAIGTEYDAIRQYAELLELYPTLFKVSEILKDEQDHVIILRGLGAENKERLNAQRANGRGKTYEQLIREAIQAENGAVEMYESMINELRETDQETAFILTEIHEDEQEHTVYFSLYLPEYAHLTKITDVLGSPEKYADVPVVMRGVLGDRPYSATRGNLVGLYDEAGNGVLVRVLIDEDAAQGEAIRTGENAEDVINEALDKVEALKGKEVFVIGFVDTEMMEKGYYGEEGPEVLAKTRDISSVSVG